MNTSTPHSHSVSVFSKTPTPSCKHFNNWFNGNTTNFGSKALQPSFEKKITEINHVNRIMPM
jgi:hypothetical protein